MKEDGVEDGRVSGGVDAVDKGGLIGPGRYLSLQVFGCKLELPKDVMPMQVHT